LTGPKNLRLLRAVFESPDYLKPHAPTAEVTEKLAREIADLALSLQRRESVELTDAKTRQQHHVAQKKNHRIARFLNRLVFCFFAEDTGLLPKNLFGEICKIGLSDCQLLRKPWKTYFAAWRKAGGSVFTKSAISTGIFSMILRYLNSRPTKSGRLPMPPRTIGRISSQASWATCLNAALIRTSGRS